MRQVRVVKTSDRRALREAAAHLDEDAQMLDGEWIMDTSGSSAAKFVANKCTRLAKRLRKIAEDEP
jgi:hypothetical protein